MMCALVGRVVQNVGHKMQHCATLNAVVFSQRINKLFRLCFILPYPGSSLLQFVRGTTIYHADTFGIVCMSNIKIVWIVSDLIYLIFTQY